MRNYGEHWLKASVAQKLRLAATNGEFNGLMDYITALYIENCKAFHAVSGTLMIFTRDAGHHSSGWFKNPDFERCLHLSLSFREPFNHRKPRQHDAILADEWCALFFGDARRLAWRETAKSPEAIELEVVHWRVFCDALWQPFCPRGEVYSLEFTERGWQSWSELHPALPEPSSLHAG